MKRMSPTVTAAWIGACALVIAAVVAGLFEFFGAQLEGGRQATEPSLALAIGTTTLQQISVDATCDGVKRRLAVNDGELSTLNENKSCVLLTRMLSGKLFSEEGYPIRGPFEDTDWAFHGNFALKFRSQPGGAIVEYLLCNTANMDRVSDSSGCQS